MLRFAQKKITVSVKPAVFKPVHVDFITFLSCLLEFLKFLFLKSRKKEWFLVKINQKNN